MFGALHKFHTEYPVEHELFSVLAPRAAAFCSRQLSILVSSVQRVASELEDSSERAQARRLMKLIDVDIAADPWLLEQPVCVYRNELVKEPYHNITLRAHERLHALIYKIREEQRQKGDDPRGSGGLPNFWLVWEITKEFDPKYGPNDFRSLDGLGYGWEKLAKVKGWRTDGTFGDGDVTEVLARVAEMEAAEATHNVGYVLECNLRLQNLMLDVISQVEESRRQPPKKKKFDGWTERFNYEPEDFNKFHRRIAIKFGTVENFVRHAAETYKKSLRTERSWRPTNRTG